MPSQWETLLQINAVSHWLDTNLESALQYIHHFSLGQWVNLLWPCDAIWHHRSGSTLAQVMACCPTALSHHQNQCWFIINRDLWHLHDDNFTGNGEDIHKSKMTFENYTFQIIAICPRAHWVNTLKLRQNGCHFTDNIFKCNFLNENVWILIKISLKFVRKDPITNIPALVQIMAWRRPGDKPLSEPMMVSLLTHICITRPQWVNGKCSGSAGWSV